MALCCAVLCGAVRGGGGETGRGRTGEGEAVSTKAKNLYYVCEEKMLASNKMLFVVL